VSAGTADRVPSAASRGDGSWLPLVPGERSVLRRILRPVLARWLGLRVEGAELVPDTGPVIVASTHRSHGDSIALAVAVRRPVHVLGDLELARVPVLGPVLPRLGMVPLRRGAGDGAALAVLRDLLGAGACVALYPEGSRSRDGRVHRLRSGLARLATDTGVPTVPAAVDGIETLWPIDGPPRLRGGRVTVRFGPPLAPPDPTPRSRRAFNDTLQATLADLGRTTTAPTFAVVRGGATPAHDGRRGGDA
jgi:1-acyl-sn-glycerol-3-phosphate acyltransferase